MIRKFMVLSLLMITLTSCGQPVRKLYSYWSLRMPGVRPVGLNGEELTSAPDTVYHIYVEVSSEVQWRTAWYRGVNYNLTANKITTLPVRVGTLRSTGKPVQIQPSSKNHLYQLEFSPGSRQVAPPAKMSKGELLLQGSWKKKLLLQRSPRVLEIETLPAY